MNQLQKLVAKVIAIFDGSIHSLAVFAAAIVAFIMLSIASDVVLRYFFNRPIEWQIEVNEICLVSIVFLGAAWVLKKEGHVKLDVLVNRLNPKNQALLNAITSFIGAAICLAIAWYGAKVGWDTFLRKVPSIGMAFPVFPRYAVIAIGSFLLCVQFSRRSYGYWGLWRALATKEKLIANR